jgi:hypothetical protein
MCSLYIQSTVDNTGLFGEDRLHRGLQNVFSIHTECVLYTNLFGEDRHHGDVVEVIAATKLTVLARATH